MPDALMLTTAQAAQAAGVSVRSVERNCLAGKLPGAVKHGRDWLVPSSVATPEAWRAMIGKPGRKPGGETEHGT